ncbi:MAG: ribonuclease D [Pseudomonadota bacterium]|nr:ribonuclease D [Pseudomonadota bacterium]
MSLINTTTELNELCDHLLDADFVTVDTEFHRESTYWPLLCLIQLGGPNQSYCIDTLSDNIDLTSLYKLLVNPKVIKVFHAARQDIEIFHHQANLIPTPIFDTQIAAMVCGFGESVGYETLVSKIVKINIDKSQRFTDWTRRPLSKKQLSYAVSDVEYLKEVYIDLQKKLEKNKRIEWLKDEIEILTNPKTYNLNPNDAWKRIKSRDKKPRFLSVLRELAAWREIEAQTQNIPRRRIVKDEVLVELANLKPYNDETIGQTRLSKFLVKSRYKEGVLKAIKLGKERPDADSPQITQKDKLEVGIGPIVELLKVLLKARSEQHNVAVKLIASVSDLQLIASDDEADVPSLRGWRRDIFGEDALKLKRGELSISISVDNKIITKPS